MAMISYRISKHISSAIFFQPEIKFHIQLVFHLQSSLKPLSFLVGYVVFLFHLTLLSLSLNILSSLIFIWRTCSVSISIFVLIDVNEFKMGSLFCHLLQIFPINAPNFKSVAFEHLFYLFLSTSLLLPR